MLECESMKSAKAVSNKTIDDIFVF